MSELDARGIRVLLCDADDCLFGSETHAFAASTEVTNRFLAEIGAPDRHEPEELRRLAAGRNFRATAAALAARHGITVEPDALERWVAEERERVVAHLAAVLRPDPRVTEPLTRLGEGYALAVVSSSALARLRACFTAAGLDELFPERVRFSAEDSLPVPASKPDPAVYEHAARRLGVEPAAGLAVEDSVSGVRSAVAAGIPVVGNLLFAGAEEREERRHALADAGAAAVVGSWEELEELLADRQP